MHNVLKISNFLSNVIRFCIYGVVALTPIFFLPFTFEFLEFNKQYLLAVLVLIGVLSWIGKAIIDKELKFHRTPLDIPLLAFWFIIFVSGILSQDRNLSFLGTYENTTIGVIPLTFYILFYFLVTNSLIKIEDIRKINLLILGSGLVSALFFFLQIGGVLAKLGVPWQFYNTVSNLNTPFGIFMIIGLVLSLNVLFIRGRKLTKDILGFIAFAVFLVALVLLGFKLVWIVAAAALFLLLVLGMCHLEEIRSSWVTVSFALLVLALIFILLGVPQFLTANLPVEVTLSQSTSWKIATETLGSSLKQFIVGSGPSTFLYDFAKFRPESLNLTFAWNIRFAAPASTFLDLLTTLGFLGMVSYVLVILLAIGTFIYIWSKNALKREGAISRLVRNLKEGDSIVSSDLLFFGMSVGWLTLLAASFIIVFSTALWVILFLYTACLMVVSKHVLKINEKPFVLSLQTSPQYSLASSFVFILVFSAVIISGIYLGRFYVANVYYTQSAKAMAAGSYDKMLAYAQKAVNYNHNSSSYNVNLAHAYLLMGGVESRKADPKIDNITAYVAAAVNQAKIATDLAPKNVATWETLEMMYENARPIAPNAVDWAIGALDRAIELENTNPSYFLKRGSLKFLLQKNDDAKKDFEEAIRLKANYVDAFAKLALLEEVRKDLNVAILRMSDAFRFAPNDPEVLFQLGRLLYNRGKGDDFALAEQAFLGAIQFNPQHSNALYSLGLIMERRGNRGEALKYYRKVLQLNPDSQEVKDKIRYLTGSEEAAPTP